MAQTEIYTIICTIVGETTWFSVEIASNKTVDQLKEKIKEKKPNRFASVDADELTLYCVDISGSKTAKREQLKMAGDCSQLEDLDPSDQLTKIYPTAPPQGTIHILVQPPQTGEKHGRLPEDDADGEPAFKRLHTEREETRPTPRQQAVSALHAKAWGKPWPQSKGTISKTEISGDESDSVDDDVDDALADKFEVPPFFKYDYFEGIQDLKRALGASPGLDFEDFLVVREEYKMLCQALEDLKYPNTFVVTGHPGIGKTTFLFYLLICRLEKKLPTAVQLGAKYYIIFDEQGAVVHPVSSEDMRLAKCWALTDSNNNVLQPCEAFQTLAKRVILTSSPKPERWKEWIKQTRGSCIISDLPSVPEIAAIVKELRDRSIQPEKQSLYNPSSTLSLVRKWGPSTRNIIRSMELGDLDSIGEEAGDAAKHICSNPATIFVESLGNRMPKGEGSSVIFLRRTPGGSVKSGKGQTFIPTSHLRAIFEEQRSTMTNQKFLQLFFTLSSHAFTRTAAGWALEQSMHKRLGMGGADLSIFQGPTEQPMRPSTHILPGTLAGLKEAGINDSFYWIPSVANFPGVDGVLGDMDGNVYTVQVTIANTHTSPEQGIKKVWEQFRPEIRARRTWHFVVITKTKQAADRYVDEFSEKLHEFTLGHAGAPVRVWGCVL